MRNRVLSVGVAILALSSLPSCATDPADEATAADEAAEDSRELGAASVASTDSGTTLGVWDCPPDRLCLWDGTSFQGTRLDLVIYNPCQNLGNYAFNNATSSYFNRWSGLWTLYTDPYCTGSRFQVPDGQSAAQMANFWNNNISSVCRGSGCP